MCKKLGTSTPSLGAWCAVGSPPVRPCFAGSSAAWQSGEVHRAWSPRSLSGHPQSGKVLPDVQYRAGECVMSRSSDVSGETLALASPGAWNRNSAAFPKVVTVLV